MIVFENIGWIGTGVMGRAMCEHIMNAEYTVHVYNRTKDKAKPLLEKGAHWCKNPELVAKNCDLVFTIVGFPEDVREVILGPQGLLSGAKEGTILVDMTTSKPSLAQTIFKKGNKRGVKILDAPVSGGDSGARNAELAIMVGGEEQVFDQVLPLFKLLGNNISYMGESGRGQHTKMSNQILIASTMIGVVESLLYAYKTGMDLNKVIDVIGKGAASSWSINNLGRRIAEEDFSPGFFIRHFIKDMGIALEEARRMNLSLPGLSLAYQFYIAAAGMGYEKDGTQGLYKVLEKLSACERSTKE